MPFEDIVEVEAENVLETLRADWVALEGFVEIKAENVAETLRADWVVLEGIVESEAGVSGGPGRYTTPLLLDWSTRIGDITAPRVDWTINKTRDIERNIAS